MKKDSIKYDAYTIEYYWENTRRKTIGISVTQEGQVYIKAPIGITREQIRQCVTQKAKWILTRLSEAEEKKSAMPDRTFEDGEELFYLGETYIFRTRQSEKIKKENSVYFYLDREKKELWMYYKGEVCSSEIKKDLIEQWYRREAKRYLSDLAQKYSEKIPCTFGTIRIKNQKTCWGSCSSRGNLNFNWRIMMAPPEITEYLVVHELCHRLEMNHSDAFWSLVQQQIPDYKKRREWLKDNGHFLEW
jgi:hypothetical protein